MPAAVAAPQPIQPSPVEIASWNAGRRNARSQYENTLAQSTFGRAQANTALNSTMGQIGTQQQQGRQTFDDPYVGRGIFNSGIRKQGLNQFLTGFDTQRNQAQQAYLNQMGQYITNDTIAEGTYGTTIQNLAEQQQAREDQLRADLAAAIKGII